MKEIEPSELDSKLENNQPWGPRSALLTRRACAPKRHAAIPITARIRLKTLQLMLLLCASSDANPRGQKLVRLIPRTSTVHPLLELVLLDYAIWVIVPDCGG